MRSLFIGASMVALVFQCSETAQCSQRTETGPSTGAKDEASSGGGGTTAERCFLYWANIFKKNPQNESGSHLDKNFLEQTIYELYGLARAKYCQDDVKNACLQYLQNPIGALASNPTVGQLDAHLASLKKDLKRSERVRACLRLFTVPPADLTQYDLDQGRLPKISQIFIDKEVEALAKQDSMEYLKGQIGELSENLTMRQLAGHLVYGSDRAAVNKAILGKLKAVHPSDGVVTKESMKARTDILLEYINLIIRIPNSGKLKKDLENYNFPPLSPIVIDSSIIAEMRPEMEFLLNESRRDKDTIDNQMLIFKNVGDDEDYRVRAIIILTNALLFSNIDKDIEDGYYRKFIRTFTFRIGTWILDYCDNPFKMDIAASVAVLRHQDEVDRSYLDAAKAKLSTQEQDLLEASLGLLDQRGVLFANNLEKINFFLKEEYTKHYERPHYYNSTGHGGNARVEGYISNGEHYACCMLTNKLKEGNAAQKYNEEIAQIPKCQKFFKKLIENLQHFEIQQTERLARGLEGDDQRTVFKRTVLKSNIPQEKDRKMEEITEPSAYVDSFFTLVAALVPHYTRRARKEKTLTALLENFCIKHVDNRILTKFKELAQNPSFIHEDPKKTWETITESLLGAGITFSREVLPFFREKASDVKKLVQATNFSYDDDSLAKLMQESCTFPLLAERSRSEEIIETIVAKAKRKISPVVSLQLIRSKDFYALPELAKFIDGIEKTETRDAIANALLERAKEFGIGYNAMVALERIYKYNIENATEKARNAEEALATKIPADVVNKLILLGDALKYMDQKFANMLVDGKDVTFTFAQTNFLIQHVDKHHIGALIQKTTFQDNILEPLMILNRKHQSADITQIILKELAALQGGKLDKELGGRLIRVLPPEFIKPIAELTTLSEKDLESILNSVGCSMVQGAGASRTNTTDYEVLHTNVFAGNADNTKYPAYALYRLNLENSRRGLNEVLPNFCLEETLGNEPIRKTVKEPVNTSSFGQNYGNLPTEIKQIGPPKRAISPAAHRSVSPPPGGPAPLGAYIGSSNSTSSSSSSSFVSSLPSSSSVGSFPPSSTILPCTPRDALESLNEYCKLFKKHNMSVKYLLPRVNAESGVGEKPVLVIANPFNVSEKEFNVSIPEGVPTSATSNATMAIAPSGEYRRPFEESFVLIFEKYDNKAREAFLSTLDTSNPDRDIFSIYQLINEERKHVADLQKAKTVDANTTAGSSSSSSSSSEPEATASMLYRTFFENMPLPPSATTVTSPNGAPPV